MNLNPQRSLESVIRQTTSQPFRFIFSVLYIGITGVVAYLNGITGCGPDPVSNPAVSIGGILLILLGLEWIELSQYPEKPSIRFILFLLITRMVLIEGIVAFDCNGIALLLFPIIPYSAHFVLGGLASSSLSLFYVVLIFWRIRLVDSLFYVDPGTPANLLAFSFAMLFVPLIASVIHRDDESRRKTEQLLIDLKISHLKLQAYAEQVADLAAAEERNRLARDIHDSLGHYLTAINIQLEKALTFQERDLQEATQAIMDAKLAAADALGEVRQSVGTLRSTENKFSLIESLQRLIDGINDDQLQVQLTHRGSETGYSRASLMILYRAAQEGLTNVQKHARASEVELNIDLGMDEATMTLSDNGQGFDPDRVTQSPSAQPTGFGLRGIRERLDLVRGKVALSSQSQQGTELHVIVPRIPFSLSEQSKGKEPWT
jgi:signal transduction histidine kinase